MTGIYQIHGPNQRSYVGQAENITARWRSHRNDLRKNRNRNPKLQRAWNKHGETALTFSILLICSVDDLNYFEQRAINSFRAVESGYNIAPIAGSTRGLKSPAVAERNRRLRGSLHPSFGKRRRDLSQRNQTDNPAKGVIRSAAFRANMSRLQSGKSHAAYKPPKKRGPIKLREHVDLIATRLRNGESVNALSREFKVKFVTMDLVRELAGVDRKRTGRPARMSV